MAESEMDSFQQRVFRRAQEISRIQTGKASETVANPTQINSETESPSSHVELNIDGENPSTSANGGKSDGGDHVSGSEKRGHSIVGGSTTDLWDMLTKMDDKIRKTEDGNTEILSNLVVTVAKMKQSLETKNKAPTKQNPIMDSTEQESDYDELDNIMDTNGESENESSEGFLRDLEETYVEKVLYGPSVSEKLGDLVKNALIRPLREESLKNLEEKHRIPENCDIMKVPKVNKELWQAFKSTRPADLAMQTCQKYMGMALVPIIKSLDVFLNNGDKNEIKDLTKDAFRILAQGMHTNTQKRKELIKPTIPMKYRKVCNDDGTSSDLLFGENLEQRVDDIEKEEKRAKKLSGYNNPGKTFLEQQRSQGPHHQQTASGQKGQDPKRYYKHTKKPYHKNVTGKPQGKPMAKSQSWKR